MNESHVPPDPSPHKRDLVKEIIAPKSLPPSNQQHPDECPICFKRMTEPTVTPCGHTFCKACITAALIESSQCPIDRQVWLLDDCLPKGSVVRKTRLDDERQNSSAKRQKKLLQPDLKYVDLLQKCEDLREKFLYQLNELKKTNIVSDFRVTKKELRLERKSAENLYKDKIPVAVGDFEFPDMSSRLAIDAVKLMDVKYRETGLNGISSVLQRQTDYIKSLLGTTAEINQEWQKLQPHGQQNNQFVASIPLQPPGTAKCILNMHISPDPNNIFGHHVVKCTVVEFRRHWHLEEK